MNSNEDSPTPRVVSELYQQWAQLQQQITWLSQLLTIGEAEGPEYLYVYGKLG